MANIEYKKIQTVLGNNWHAVVDGDWLFYPCGEDLDEVQKFVQIFEDEIVEKRHSRISTIQSPLRPCTGKW